MNLPSATMIILIIAIPSAFIGWSVIELLRFIF